MRKKLKQRIIAPILVFCMCMSMGINIIPLVNAADEEWQLCDNMQTRLDSHKCDAGCAEDADFQELCNNIKGTDDKAIVYKDSDGAYKAYPNNANVVLSTPNNLINMQAEGSSSQETSTEASTAEATTEEATTAEATTEEATTEASTAEATTEEATTEATTEEATTEEATTEEATTEATTEEATTEEASTEAPTEEPEGEPQAFYYGARTMLSALSDDTPLEKLTVEMDENGNWHKPECASYNADKVIICGNSSECNVHGTPDNTVNPQDKTELLKSQDTFEWSLLQDGEPIIDNTIDSSKDIAATCSFKVPVEGDYFLSNQQAQSLPEGEEQNYIYTNDTATFAFPEQLRFTDATAEKTLDLDNGTGQKIGTVTFHNADADHNTAYAYIVFDFSGLVTDMSEIYSVTAQFDAYLQAVVVSGGNTTISKDETIFDKDYEITVPDLQDKLTIKKTGKLNSKSDIITWEVTIDRVSNYASNNHNLEGVLFEDSLADVGEYVADSFTIGEEAVAPSYDSESKSLSYTFGKVTGPKTISFATKVEDYTSAEAVTNTATASKEGLNEVSDSDTVVLDYKWITKKGEAVAGGKYDEKGNYVGQIKWTIIANESYKTIKNPKIIDSLPANLEFVSASMTTEPSNGQPDSELIIFTAEDNLTFSAKGELIFDVATAKQDDTPILDKKIVLTVITNVVGVTAADGVINFQNTATLIGDGLSSTVTSSTSEGVGVGEALISKTVNPTYNRAENTLEWTVTVDTKGQAIDNLYVIDIINAGASTQQNPIPWNNLLSAIKAAVPEGSVVQHLTVDAIKQHQADAQYQRFVENSFTADENAQLECYIAKTGDYEVLIVTGKDGAELPAGKSVFTYKTTLYAKYNNTVNPFNWSNSKSNKVYSNFASLFQDGAFKNTAKAEKALQSVSIDKTKDRSDSNYNYQDQTMTFHISVNTNAINMGKDWSVKDKAPDGFKFVEYSDDVPFELYQSSHSPSDCVGTRIPLKQLTQITGSKLEEIVSFVRSADDKKWTWEFNGELDHGYEIRLKIKLIDDSILFDPGKNGGSFNLRNYAYLYQNDKEYAHDWEDFSGKTQLLSKTSDVSKAESEGEISWTVEYKPYGHYSDSSINSIKLVDHLSGDVTLKLDEYRIPEVAVQTGTLNKNGTYEYTTADPSAYTVEYQNAADSAEQILTFTLHDKEKAYKISYAGTITGGVGDTISNKVALIVNTEEIFEVKAQQYRISNASASAAYKLSNNLIITKTDTDGESLSGATFTLTDANGDVYRTGSTGANGKLILRIFDAGKYTLKEVTPPTGYKPIDTEWNVDVTEQKNKTLKVTVNGTAQNQLEVENEKLETGSLTIGKTVTGSTDTSGEFTFRLFIGGGSEQTYEWESVGNDPVKADAINQGGEVIHGGENTLVLTHGQKIQISGLEAGTSYCVEEIRVGGYQVSISENGAPAQVIAPYEDEEGEWVVGTEGGIEEAQAASVQFINRKPGSSSETTTENTTEATTENITENTTTGGSSSSDDNRWSGNNSTIINRLPNPNTPDSPQEIIIVDEEEVPLGSFTKEEQPDETFIYIDEEDVPLAEFLEEFEEDVPLAAMTPVPQTGDETPVVLLCVVALLGFGGAGALILYKKKK